MWISLRPLDTLFFKDGKPFSMGEDTWAEGLFPPPPSVFLGAVRTAVLGLQPEVIARLGTNDPTSNIRIDDVQIAYNEPNEFRFICPLDLVKRKDANQFHLLKLKRSNYLTSNTLEQLLVNEKLYEIESCGAHHWLDHSSFGEYLNGDTPGSPTTFRVTSEPKIGIGRNREVNAASEAMLYRVGMQRFSDEEGNHLFFNLKVEGLPESSRQLWERGEMPFMKLGAESKAVLCEVLHNFSPPAFLPKFDRDDRYFKWVLATPTIFQHPEQKKFPARQYGWIPSFIDPDTWEGYWQGRRVKLVSAAVGKPQSIGGFDMLKKEPKPMLKMVPAGSVYFFRLLDEDEDISAFANSLSGPMSVTDVKSEEGFGLAYLGKVDSQLPNN